MDVNYQPLVLSSLQSIIPFLLIMTSLNGYCAVVVVVGSIPRALVLSWFSGFLSKTDL